MAPSEHERLHLLQTEARTSTADKIDFLDTLGLCEAFNKEESRVAGSIASCLSDIASLIDDVVPRLRAGGRLIYVGAGNSGRVGFMDCSELPVTFSADPQQFITIVAGGTEAIIKAQEGAEDMESEGALRMEALQLSRPESQTHIHPALPNSESTTSSVLWLALNSFRVALDSKQAALKGLMIDVRVKNWKLKARGRRIVRQACNGAPMHIIDQNGLPSPQAIDIPETVEGDAAIDILIEGCGGSVKLACAVAISGYHPDVARQMLESAGGSFHVFVEGVKKETSPKPVTLEEGLEYCLCVDGGGTNCTVSIATRSGVIGQGIAGPCNFNSVTLGAIINHIKLATDQASSMAFARQGFALPTTPKFSKVWVGLAGLHHADQIATLTRRLEELFGVSTHCGTLRLTSDGILLGSCIAMDNSVEFGISVVAGTGSVATAFKKGLAGEIIQVGRTGGWGYLIGDQGSAFDIGKRALQLVLSSVEQKQFQAKHELTEFERVILNELNSNEVGVLKGIYHSNAQPKEKVSNIARVVTKLGFREQDPDPQALEILTSAANCLAQQIKPLAEICDPSRCALILSGALMNLPAYQDLILREWDRQHQLSFKKVLVVNDASVYAAQFLARQNTIMEWTRECGLLPSSKPEDLNSGQT
ncbi:putative glucokinase regulator family protein [Aspergillus alliaceus]|uniref:putative glucokinase regulator family protein n=1 Tax=Petromyces alliaceus TaxID=209559 RepID=UPI0012A4A458|nr:uncharacterized protein BDW43DRAFT_269730 [Aspergillus alliaceus]KAB8235828.1 hypothetical protein BDW43DRAFT_269730 [Aspergillus alliaceus]